LRGMQLIKNNGIHPLEQPATCCRKCDSTRKWCALGDDFRTLIQSGTAVFL
jgi:hypothetical protein